MLPHFADWLVEMDHSQDFTFLPQQKSVIPKAFFERVGMYEKPKKSKVPDTSNTSLPQPPPNYDNGIFASGAFELTWEAECGYFTQSMEVFRQWNGPPQLSNLRRDHRTSKDILHRAMSVTSPISISEGTGSNVVRISAKWRIAMLLLSLHNTRCRRPIMKTKGITAGLYSQLVDALRDSAIQPDRYDFIVGHSGILKDAKFDYFDDPVHFVRRLQGLADEEADSDDEDDNAPLAMYNQRRKDHKQDIQALRRAFKNITWIHIREKVNGEIDNELVEAWNAFEAVSPSSLFSSPTIPC